MGRVVTEDELVDAVAGRSRSAAGPSRSPTVLRRAARRSRAIPCDAAAQADRLIVAVNDDESVTGLKGPGRPILSAADRAEMVAALESVDYVVRVRRSRCESAARRC